MAVTPAIRSNQFARRALRRALATLIRLQGDQTADILRYTQSAAGNPAIGIPPTKALVSGLTGLLVLTDSVADTLLRKRAGSEIELKEGERLFFFIDIPAAGSVAANTLTGDDVILFGGVKWAPVDRAVCNDSVTGHSWAKCRMVNR